jgi:hypothetical protein
MKSSQRNTAGTLLSIIVVLAVYDIEKVPPLWWDESWTLNVVHNWQQLEHYGRSLIGQPTPPGLESGLSPLRLPLV